VARKRNQPVVDESPVEETPTDNNTNTQGVNSMSSMDAFLAIEDDELNSAISGSRTRGIYDSNLLAFFDSGRRGVEVNLADGIHEGKKAQSVKTGYESAREKIVNGKNTEASDEQVEAAKATKVIGKTNPDRVFLVRSDVGASS